MVLHATYDLLLFTYSGYSAIPMPPQMKRRLSEIHPFFYHVRILQKRMFRRVADLPNAGRFASEINSANLPFSCKKHQSLLRRRLGNADPQLQENKIENLKIACPTIDGILIRPGQTFSFWRQIGEATAVRGYFEGMQLSQGEVVRGIGGGLCQLANLLYWMALHTPLEIAERHHHSFDPFPDENRVRHSAAVPASFLITLICGFLTRPTLLFRSGFG